MPLNRVFLYAFYMFFSSIKLYKSCIIFIGVNRSKKYRNILIPSSYQIDTKGSEHSDTECHTYTLVYVAFVSSWDFSVSEFVSEWFLVLSFKRQKTNKTQPKKGCEIVDEKEFLKLQNLVATSCTIPQLKSLIRVCKMKIENEVVRLEKEFKKYAKTM